MPLYIYVAQYNYCCIVYMNNLQIQYLSYTTSRGQAHKRGMSKLPILLISFHKDSFQVTSKSLALVLSYVDTTSYELDMSIKKICILYYINYIFSFLVYFWRGGCLMQVLHARYGLYRKCNQRCRWLKYSQLNM